MSAPSDQDGSVKSLRSRLDLSTSSHCAPVSGNVPAINALTEIERRAQALKDKALANHRKFEDRWTAKEAIRIWEKQIAMKSQHPAPPGMKQGVTTESILKAAERNVRARTNRRLSLINPIKTRMSNALVRNMMPLAPQQTMTDSGPDRVVNESAVVRKIRRQQ